MTINFLMKMKKFHASVVLLHAEVFSTNTMSSRLKFYFLLLMLFVALFLSHFVVHVCDVNILLYIDCYICD